MKFHIGSALGWLLYGKYRYLWPDFACTRKTSPKTRPARRWWRKGKLVTPLEHYSFHTNFDVRTDGKQWLLRCVSSYISNRVNAGFFALIGTVWLAIFSLANSELGNVLPFWVGTLLLIPAFPFIFIARTGGEDTWIVLDRTTGNVCFWKRKAKKSLTVPFDQVKCYWLTRSLRGGVSHHLCLMPEVNLPNERNRHWEVMMGSTPMYEQAQYFWRVINDFMNTRQPIPEVDGLIHQVRSMEKLGYNLEDITHGGKEVPIKEWEAVEKELRNDAQALEARLERFFTPEHFDAQAIYDFYQSVPVYFKKDALRKILIKYEMFSGRWRYPGFGQWGDEYEREVLKLGELLTGLPSRESYFTHYG